MWRNVRPSNRSPGEGSRFRPAVFSESKLTRKGAVLGLPSLAQGKVHKKSYIYRNPMYIHTYGRMCMQHMHFAQGKVGRLSSNQVLAKGPAGRALASPRRPKMRAEQGLVRRETGPPSAGARTALSSENSRGAKGSRQGSCQRKLDRRARALAPCKSSRRSAGTKRGPFPVLSLERAPFRAQVWTERAPFQVTGLSFGTERAPADGGRGTGRGMCRAWPGPVRAGPGRGRLEPSDSDESSCDSDVPGGA